MVACLLLVGLAGFSMADPFVSPFPSIAAGPRQFPAELMKTRKKSEGRMLDGLSKTAEECAAMTSQYDDISACDTEESCGKVNIAGVHAVWSPSSLYLGCFICSIKKYYHCPKDLCSSSTLKSAAYTFGWDKRVDRCGKCGLGEVSGCTTKADCEKQELEGGKPVWNEEKQICGSCAKDDVRGCITKELCEGRSVKTDGYTVKTTWEETCGSCSAKKCGDGETEGCTTKAECENTKFQYDFQGVAVWWEASGECRACGQYSLDGCATKEQCEKWKHTWNEGSSPPCQEDLVEPKSCKAGDLEECKTKATCEAHTAGSGKAVWYEGGEFCAWCSSDSPGGCQTKELCAGLKANRYGFQPFWAGNLCMACSLLEIDGCTTKEICSNMIKRHSKLMWDFIKWENGACRSCSNKTDDGKCLPQEICKTQKEFRQEQCAKSQSECAKTCSQPRNQGMCSFLGISSDGSIAEHTSSVHTDTASTSMLKHHLTVLVFAILVIGRAM